MGLQIIEQIYQGLKKLTGDEREHRKEQWWAPVGQSAAPKPVAHRAPH